MSADLLLFTQFFHIDISVIYQRLGPNKRRREA